MQNYVMFDGRINFPFNIRGSFLIKYDPNDTSGFIRTGAFDICFKELDQLIDCTLSKEEIEFIPKLPLTSNDIAFYCIENVYSAERFEAETDEEAILRFKLQKEI